ncbi:MAG: LCP family protein [Actinobacteria bacterium]|nr:LCP family protein [Actinomycetota bacterium]
MNKARGCFIAFLVIFVISLLAVLLFALSSRSNFFNSGNSEDNSENTVSFSDSKDYLFLGVDERENLKEFKGRTDTIMIYHVSGWGKKDVLISVPRDTRVNLEDHGWNKINAAYVYGGEEMLKKEIYDVTGISIRRTMMLNFEGFKRVIDALGGVEITVDEPMHDPLSGADFEPGTYIMNGEEALAFARCRKTAGGDFDRVDRQKYLISQLIKQKINFSVISKAPQLISILNEETRSDFAMSDIVTFGAILLFSDKEIERVTIPGKTATIDGISYVVIDVDEVRQFLNPYLN